MVDDVRIRIRTVGLKCLSATCGDMLTMRARPGGVTYENITDESLLERSSTSTLRWPNRDRVAASNETRQPRCAAPPDGERSNCDRTARGADRADTEPSDGHDVATRDRRLHRGSPLRYTTLRCGGRRHLPRRPRRGPGARLGPSPRRRQRRSRRRRRRCCDTVIHR